MSSPTEPQSASSSTVKGSLPELVLVCDAAGRIRWASSSVEALLGRTPAAVVDTELAALLHPLDRVGLGEQPGRVLASRGPSDSQVLRFLRADHTWLPLQVTATDLQQIAGGREPLGAVVVTGFDFAGPPHPADLAAEHGVILERIARGAPVLGTLEGIALGLSRRLGHLGVIVGLTDGDGAFRVRSTCVPTELLEVLDDTEVIRPRLPAEVEASERLGPPTVRCSAASCAVVASASAGVLRGCWAVDIVGGSGPAARLVVLHPDDRAPSAAEAALVERAADLVAVAVERIAAQARLERHQQRDELTGLANRHLVVSCIGEAFAARPTAGVGVLSCDLDGFKLINDSLGPEAGDRLLREVAHRFARAVRPEDVVARVGADDFVVLCPDVADDAELVRVADRLADELRVPIELGVGPVVVTASVGVVRAAKPTEPTLLLRDADLALQEARRRGRGHHAIYAPALQARAVARFDVELALRDALRRQEMRLVYQPLVSLADGTVQGFEALLRWERPGVGAAAPSDFVPVATETGLILPIGRWAIERAVAEATAWGGVPISVNLSASQLADPDLVGFVADVLARHGLPPRLLCLEVTESDLAVEPVPSAEVLRRLAATGVRLAIDDFGTGFATLDYLRHYSMAHAIKIDGSFVAGLLDPVGPDLAIVSAALLLARNLGFETVAEGVETDEQREALRRLGCDRGQGHLFSAPLSSAEVSGWLGTRSRPTTAPA
ncbi:MAG: hypothetical protein JWN46_566 [Acidimicrobiales bacterium]|nr:hypothetical protein [Acidimicrobiales bacterium]